MTLANQSTTTDFQHLLKTARQLPVTEQRRLLDELTALVQVHLVQPNPSQEAIRRGRQMAKEVRNELKTSMSGSLEETISQLRGRSW